MSNCWRVHVCEGREGGIVRLEVHGGASADQPCGAFLRPLHRRTYLAGREPLGQVQSIDHAANDERARDRNRADEGVGHEGQDRCRCSVCVCDV